MSKQSSNIISRGRNRRNLPMNSQPEITNVLVDSTNVVAAVITLTFGQPVQMTGIPQYASQGVNGGLPVSAQQTSDRDINLTYAATQAVSTSVTVPPNETSIRTRDGRYVNPQVVNL